MEEISISDVEIYERLLEKVDKVRDNLVKIRDYSKTNNINNRDNYLKKLSQTCSYINIMHAFSCDTYDEFILQLKPELITKEDQEERRNVIINKKIEKLFLPYMLYMQIILKSNNDNSNS